MRWTKKYINCFYSIMENKHNRSSHFKHIKMHLLILIINGILLMVKVSSMLLHPKSILFLFDIIKSFTVIFCLVWSSLFFIKIMKSCTKTRESSLQWLFKSRLFCLALGMFAISLALWPTPPLKSWGLKALPSATLFYSKDL